MRPMLFYAACLAEFKCCKPQILSLGKRQPRDQVCWRAKQVLC